MNKLVFTCLLVLPSLLLAQPSRKGCEGFAPKNNVYIPVTHDANATGISEADWTSLFDKYEKIYTPIIKAHGGNLQLNRLWDDGTANANADRDGDTWVINMYGGLARYQDMTKDGMMMVVCHETGHQLGGAPKFGGDASTGANPDEWAADEGEADYYSALKCMRVMLADEDNVAAVSKMQIDPAIVTACSAQYTAAQDVAICERTSQTGVVLAGVLNSLGQGSVIPAVGTPTTTAVDATNDDHPAAQCRLDTYFQSSLCTAPVSTELSNGDYHTGACTAPSAKLGLRPACWFKAAPADNAANLSLAY